jgi:hypothetical protein
MWQSVFCIGMESVGHIRTIVPAVTEMFYTSHRMGGRTDFYYIPADHMKAYNNTTFVPCFHGTVPLRELKNENTSFCILFTVISTMRSPLCV